MPTLDFKGKQFIYAHHLTVPFRKLEIGTEKPLQAKCLHALKALLPKHAGKIKCISINLFYYFALSCPQVTAILPDASTAVGLFSISDEISSTFSARS